MATPTHDQLDKAFKNNHNKFDQLLGELTPRELSKYLETSTKEKDLVVYIWSYHISWGFESCWADWVLMSPEEREKQQLESPDYDGSPPDNFEIDTPLKNIGRWHLADAAADRGLM
jgi:hypothetical protein